MIICPTCNAENVDNTLFCTECGDFLQGDSHDSPATSLEGVMLHDLVLDSSTPSDPTKNLGTGPLAISLEIGEVKRSLQIPLTKPIHMGRIDPNGNIFPEVDLTYDGGAEKGVSRRHARILKKNQLIYIEDLGSSNGTFVNGEKLMPYFPEQISDGDAIRLGRLQIKVVLSQK